MKCGTMKRVLSIILVIAMLFSINSTAFATVINNVGDSNNGKVVSLSVDFYAETGDAKISSVEENDWFRVAVNFGNNPTDEDTVENGNILLQWDNTKVYYEDTDATEAGLVTVQTWNGYVSEDESTGVFVTGITADGGIKSSGRNAQIQTGGTLFYIYFMAREAMDEAALRSAFKYLAEYTPKNKDKVTLKMGNCGIIALPDFSVTPVADVKFFEGDGADAVKNNLTFTYTAVDGTTPTVNADSVTVTLPEGGLTAGKNVCTAVYNGASTEFTVTAEAVSVISLSAATPSNFATAYTSGEKLDLNGLTVTANKNNGKSETVTDYTVKLGDTEATVETVLKVADNGKLLTVCKDGISAGVATLTVSPKTVPVPEISDSFTYDRTEHAITLTDTEDYTVGGDTAKTDAGSYTAVASLTDAVETVWADGSSAPKSLSWSIAANTGALTVTLTDAAEIVYDGTAKVPAITVMSGETPLSSGTDFTAAYSDNTNAGTAAVTVTGAGNYAGANGSVTFAIVPAEPKAEHFRYASPTNLGYDGQVKAAVVTAEDGIEGMGEITVVYSADGGATWTAEPQNAGSYAVGVQLAGGTNYQDKTVALGQSFTVTPAVLTIATVTAAEKTYDGTTDVDVTVVFAGLQNGETLTVGTDYTVSAAYASADAGESVNVTGTVTLADSVKNYVLSNGTISAEGKINPTETTLTLTAQDMTYTGRAYEETNLASSSNLSNAEVSLTYYADNEGKKGEALGEAPVNAGTYWVEGSIAASTNATGAADEASFTITPAALTIETVTVAEKTYDGETNADVTVVFAGLQNGETLTVETDYTVSAAYASADAGESVNVTGTVTLADSVKNYVLSNGAISAAGKVNRAASTLGITAADADYSGFAYAESNITKTANPADSTVSLSYYADNEGAKGEALAAVPMNAGTYWVEGSIATSTNFASVTSEAVRFTINKASITDITEPKYSVFYGDTSEKTMSAADFGLPAGESFTVSVNGTPASDSTILASASGNTFALKEGLSAEDAGKSQSFTVTVSSENYQTVTTGVTVEVVDISIEWPEFTALNEISYGGTYADIFPAFTEAGTARTTVDLTGRFSVKTPDGKPDAGTTTAILVFTLDEGQAVSGEFTKNYTCPAVLPKTLTVTPDAAQSKEYGEADSALSYTHSGAVGTETPVFTGALSRAEGEDAGSYAIQSGTLALADGQNGFRAANYTLSVTEGITFAVTAKNLGKATVTDIAAQTYTGAALTPEVTVKDGGKTLASGTDFDAAYADNTNAGTATVTITGKGNYTGSVTKEFTVQPKNLAEATVTDIEAQTYTGEAIEPTVTVKDGDTTLTKDTDYTVSYASNTGVGTATVTITGEGNYTGTAEVCFTVQPKPLSEEMPASIAAQTYTGEDIEPAVTVKDGSTTLTKDTDYTVSYASNTDAGTATVTITGKGNYSGSVTKEFTIQPKPLSADMAEAPDALTYTGAALTPEVIVKDGDRQLASGTDFDAVYADNTKAGTASVTLTGKGNYAGTVTVSFTVEPLTVIVEWGEKEFRYDGSEHGLTATITNLAEGDEVTAVITGGRQTAIGSSVGVINALSGRDAASYTLTGAENLSATLTVKPALDEIVASPTSITAELDEKTIRLVGYCDEGAEITVNGAAVVGGKVTINGVEFTVDLSGVVTAPADVEIKTPEVDMPPFDAASASETNITQAIYNDIAKTTTENLDAAAAGVIDDIEAAKPEGTVKVEVTFKMRIEPKQAVTEGNRKSLKLELKPQVEAVYKDASDTDLRTTKKDIENQDIRAEITVSVKIPDFLKAAAKLVAKHTKNSGSVEYLNVDIMGEWAVFKIGSFSEVELVDDARAATATNLYTSTGAVGDPIVYTAVNIGTALPTDTKSGYSFKGWKVTDGDGTCYTAVTEEMLNTLNGQTVQLESVFEKNTPSTPVTPVTPTISTYTIMAEATEGGVITPSGEVTVKKNGEQTFTFIAQEGYVLKKLIIDGESAAPAESYSFTKVRDDHSIRAVFERKAEMQFPDVQEDQWFYEAVRYVFENGIMQGTDLGFEPRKATTRAELSMMLWRLAGTPSVEAESSFTDVEAGKWYTEAVIWAASESIVNGFEDGSFRPNAAVTREQFAAMLYRFAKAMGEDVSVDEGADVPDYKDASEISAYALPAIQWASGLGLLRGDDLGNMNPKSGAIRAETATIFMRYCELGN